MSRVRTRTEINKLKAAQRDVCEDIASENALENHRKACFEKSSETIQGLLNEVTNDGIVI